MENFIRGLFQIFCLAAGVALGYGTVQAILAGEWGVVLFAGLLTYMALNIGTAGWLGEQLFSKLDGH